MNKFRTLIIGSAILAVSTVAFVHSPLAAPDGAAPGGRPFMHGMMHGGFGGAPLISMALDHKAELNLSSQQVANLENIKSQYQSQVTPLNTQLRALEKDIGGLSRQSPANLIQIKSKIQEGEKYRTELRYLRVEALENGKSVLSAQQQDQLKTLLRAQHEQFRSRRSQPS
jgi:Spy/CpxP family protein refolding chaperone